MRLDWDVVGQRFYETGVDRGVLYLFGNGFAWPGLISVTESPTGGEAKPRYIDGFKYLNLAAAEEFEATIVAFYAPPEFAVCDGTVSVHNGLFATQQPRKQFDFSYRTKIGNDLEGPDHAYKIHLVYGALAAPTERGHTTLSNSPEAATNSWAITTLPPMVPGMKPTAHYVIDSRSTDVALLSSVEEILYGSEASGARLPTAIELIELFNV